MKQKYKDTTVGELIIALKKLPASTNIYLISYISTEPVPIARYPDLLQVYSKDGIIELHIDDGETYIDYCEPYRQNLFEWIESEEKTDAI